MKGLRIGVVGTGHIARVNAMALVKTGRAEIAALCNHHIEKARALGADIAPDARVYADCQSMLEDVRLDAVILCTPQDVHMRDFIACAKAGVHVMVEKPLAMNGEQCEQMILARNAAGIRAAVCHTQRYLAPMMTLKQVVDSGMLGEPVSALDVIDMQFFTSVRPAWFYSRERSGSALLYTHGSHQFDRLMVLLGRHADWVDAHIEMTDDALPEAGAPGLDCGYHILGQMGRHAFVIDCGGYSMPLASGVTLRFTHGTARMVLKETGIEPIGVFVSRNGSAFEAVPLVCSQEDAYVRQMNDLLNALEGEENNAPTLEHGLRVMRCLEAAKASHLQKRRVVCC